MKRTVIWAVVLLLAVAALVGHEMWLWNKAEDFYREGLEHTERHEHEEAIAAYKKAVAVKPLAKAYYKMGRHYVDLGRHRDVISAYEKAIAITTHKKASADEPGLAEAHNYVGRAHFILKQYQNAADSLRKAVEIKPDRAVAHYELGLACQELKRYRNAADAFRKAVELKSDYVEAYFGLARACEHLKKYPEARQAYEKIVTLDPMGDNAESARKSISKLPQPDTKPRLPAGS